MQFTWAAVIVHAIGRVAVLLGFQQDRSRPDGMHGTRIHEDHVAPCDREDVEAFFERTVMNSGLDLFHRYAGLEAGRNPSARFGGDGVPAFRFAAWLTVLLRHPVIGMDLDAEFFARKDHF